MAAGEKIRSNQLDSSQCPSNTAQAHLVIQQHQIKGKHPDDHLDILDPDILLRPVRKVLKGTESAGILVQRDDFSVNYEGGDVFGAQ